MDRLLFQLYLAEGDRKKLVFLSADPGFDRAYLQNKGFDSFCLLSSPLPLGIASQVYFHLFQKVNAHRGVSAPPSEESIKEQTRRSLQHFGQKNAYPCLDRPSPSTVMCFPDFREMKDLEALLKGRLLSVQEIFMFSGALNKESLYHSLQCLSLERKVLLLPALYSVKGDLVHCQRCGWEGIPDVYSCAKCGSEKCCNCPECGVLGNLSFCDQLYTAETEIAAQKHSPGWKFWRPRNGIAKVSSGQIFCRPLFIEESGKKLSIKKKGSAAKALSNPRGLRQAVGGGSRISDSYANLLGEIRFTPSQEKAAARLLNFGNEENSGGKCLVWAACGAGKTEVSFPLIQEVLNRRQKVLFATPRRDVVLEIAPRMAKAFGEKRVNALYGGSGNHGRTMPLLVATTHQSLRFFRMFDLVILDEGDAFPFPGNRMLHFGVEKARLPGGKLVYLTATPAPWMYHGGSKTEVIRIPVRPHGFPLPVPEFSRLKPFRISHKKMTINPRLLDIIEELINRPKSRLFIFVPRVPLTFQVAKALQEALKKKPYGRLKAEGIQWTHAGDQERALKRERFFAGEFPVLVTTTIMERGVTVPRVHVLVLEAGQEGVFDTPTLVQIAGRCGRSPECPTGKVFFVSSGVSRSMREARAQIMGLNKEAMSCGYLRKDWEKVLKGLS